MKPLIPTIVFALCWFLAIVPEDFFDRRESIQSNGTGDTTLVRKLVTSKFNVLIQRAEDGDDIYAVVTTMNSGGLKIDRKALVETMWRVDSNCHRHQEYGEYQFKTNQKFTFKVKSADIWCGLERKEDENDLQYMDRLASVEDPYEIPARELKQVNVERYDIDESGKIKLAGADHEVIKDQWLAMNRFDLLPKEKLVLLRNTIFAKKGYIFKTPELQAYFSKKPWYLPTHDNIAKFLSASDRKMIDYLEKLERR
jgi:hypothetical protein